MTQYTPAYRMADFAQSIDRSRPPVLLTADPNRAPHLRYRYEDTGETVTVPTGWHTLPIESCVESMRFNAETLEARAEELTRNPPRNLPKQLVQRMADRARARALVTRTTAQRLAQEGESFFAQVPVIMGQFNAEHCEY